MRRGLCLLLLLLGSQAVLAQAWPNKPVKLVFPYPAGGNGDALARLVGNAISKGIGQNVLVEFMPGGNGSIGTGYVARAQADGYTFLFTSGTTVVQNKLLRKNLGYDTETDLTPVARFASQPMLIVVNPAKVPAKNLKEFLDYAKANPGKINSSTPGIGSLGQLAVHLVEAETGVRITLVPYATGKRTIDLLSGEIDMTIDPPGPYISYVPSGKLVGIAVMSAQRSEALPDVPTTAEQGYPRLASEAWYGVWGPKALAPDIVGKVNAALVAFLGSADGQAQLRQYSMIAKPTSPDGLREYVKQELTRWEPLIRAANISVD